MPFKVELIDMDRDAKRIMPISMDQKYHSGERLEALIKSAAGTNTTILIADYLQRHNTKNAAAALKKGAKFLHKNSPCFKSAITIDSLEEWNKHKDLSVVKVVRWQTWGIIKKAELVVAQETIEASSQEGSKLLAAMKRAAATCFSTQSEESSIHYQKEENAYLLTFTNFIYHIYPKALNDSQLEVYKQLGAQYKLPQHVIPRFINIEVEGALKRGMFAQKVMPEEEAKGILVKKQTRSLHPTLRMVLMNLEMAISSPEISLEGKKAFLQECNGLFISLGFSLTVIEDQRASLSSVNSVS